MSTPTRYLTTIEAAERLRETPETVARRCKAGVIPAAKVGRSWRIAESVIDGMLRPTNRSRVSSTAGKQMAGAAS